MCILAKEAIYDTNSYLDFDFLDLDPDLERCDFDLWLDFDLRLDLDLLWRDLDLLCLRDLEPDLCLLLRDLDLDLLLPKPGNTREIYDIHSFTYLLNTFIWIRILVK